jgi:hypothetical protein
MALNNERIHHVRFGISTRVGRHLRVGMSVPVQVQPRYKSRMKPTKPPKPERVEGITAISGVFIILGVTALVALALIGILSILMPLH